MALEVSPVRALMPRILVVLLLLAAGGVIGGSLLRNTHPHAELIGWSIGLLFAFLAAFAASHVFSRGKDE
jgi:hypothetical protein